jgi:hypothetical protein
MRNDLRVFILLRCVLEIALSDRYSCIPPTKECCSLSPPPPTPSVRSPDFSISVCQRGDLTDVLHSYPEHLLSFHSPPDVSIELEALPNILLSSLIVPSLSFPISFHPYVAFPLSCPTSRSRRLGTTLGSIRAVINVVSHLLFP